jgi:hypothetical protein
VMRYAAEMLNIAVMQPGGKERISLTVLLNEPHIVGKSLALIPALTDENDRSFRGYDKS